MILTITQEEMREKAIDWITEKGLILELGCGTGNFAKQLYMRNIRNPYMGIDISPTNIRESRIRELGFDFKFWLCDILNDAILEWIITSDVICSFEVLEHVGKRWGDEDLELVSKFPKNKRFIFSVPNSPYQDRHVRWYELDGWVDRYSELLEFEKKITIQNPRKEKKRCFLFDSRRK